MHALSNCFDITTPGGFTAYVNYLNKIPRLSYEREKYLFYSFQRNSDLEAAREIANSHLKLVVWVVGQFSGYQLNKGDLVQEGNIGLLKAIKKFKVSKGVRFATYAVNWIRSEIKNYIIKNWKIFRLGIGRAHKKLFDHLSKIKDPENDEIVSQQLQVSVSDISSMRDAVNNSNYVPIGESSDDLSGGAVALQSSDETTNPEELVIASQSGTNGVYDALDQLDERERDIIFSRKMKDDPETLNDLSKRLGISMERVRQIEAAALDKLKTALVSS